MKRVLALILALLMGLSLAGCGAKNKPAAATPIEANTKDALSLLSLFVNFYQVYDLSFGDSKALLDIEFYVDGKRQGSSGQVGPIEPENAGRYVFAVMEHYISGQAVYKVALAQMDHGTTYMVTHTAEDSQNITGAKYSISQAIEPENIQPNVRTPIYGVFYTPNTEKSAATIEEALPTSGVAIVFYLTIQQ